MPLRVGDFPEADLRHAIEVALALGARRLLAQALDQELAGADRHRRLVDLGGREVLGDRYAVGAHACV